QRREHLDEARRRGGLRLMLGPLVWFWDAVTQDCHGQPEVAVVYVVTQMLKEPAGYRSDCSMDPETGETLCVRNIVYLPTVLVSQDIVEATEYPQESVYVPAAGGVTFLDIAAMDAAGNISLPESCP